MLPGVFALLERSLRVNARGWQTHLARFGLIGAIYISLCLMLMSQSAFGAPGLQFFQKIAYLDIAFLTLLGVSFFSTSITEEKEEGTLGLMLMAGISPSGILAGKSAERVWQAFLLIAVQYPFTLLAVTMGGITPGQIWAVTVALTAYMIFLAGLGLFCSTIAPRSRVAGGYMAVGIGIYVLIPSACMELARICSRWGNPNTVGTLVTFLNNVGNAGIIVRMGDILSTGFAAPVIGIQVISNLAAGVIFAGLSWLLFGVANQSPSTHAVSRGLVSRRRAFFPFAAGRPWINPFFWKDFYFVSGGPGMFCVRLAFYTGLAVSIFGLNYVSGFTIGSSDDPAESFLLLSSMAVSIDAGLILARCVQDEIREQTWPSLLLLPRSSTGIIYAKFAGAMLGWIPGPAVELIVTLCTDCGRSDFAANLRNEDGGWTLLALYAIVPHIAPLAATCVRWGAVPIAIGATICIFTTIVSAVSDLNGLGLGDDLFFHVATFAMFCICFGCHIGVLLRVRALGHR